MTPRAPVVGISRSPLAPLSTADFRRVAEGIPIASTAPAAGGTLLCRVNGDWLSRESWGSETRAGDVIEWHDLPQDRDTLRGILSIAAIAFLGPAGLGLQGAALLIANVVAQTAINALLPPTVAQGPNRPSQTGDSFSTSLNGNEARLDQPIWKVCGRREFTPPFACQPYLEYLPRDGAEDPELDREQYYYALLAVGVGDHDIAAVKIGNTPISRFADVLVAQYLPPGTPPSTVLPNVTTAQEVSSQVLESGLYVGGFAACAARRTCAAIGIDVVATRGLGKTGALSVSWRVEYRPINDFGQILGPWALLANEEREAFTATPQRWSNKYTLGTAARVEIRVVRTDEQDTSPSALHEIAWTGLRAYLAEPAPLNEHTAHFEVVLRASSQLSNGASRDVRVIAEAHARSLDSGLDWVAAAPTRNPAWWVLDLVTSGTWGLNRPDDRVDLQSFYDLAQVCDQRQDRFDFVFDSTMDGWTAAQLIARACRARVFRRGLNGVISVARDALADVPVTVFMSRNCMPGSMRISEALRTRKSPDGIVIEYQDHRTWEWTESPCPLPGLDLSDMVNPVRVKLPGVTGATHAQREGLYEAANALYRKRTAQWTTEMQGLLLSYLTPVGVAFDVPGYGVNGDVAFWDADTLVMGLTEAPDWSQAPLFLTLVRDDGTSTDPVEVTPGPTANDITLPAAPDFDLVLDDGTRERPKFVLGATDMVKVMAIEPAGETDDGAQLYQLSGLIDDERVHTADVHLLPGPGDVQDPVGNPDDSDEGGGTLLQPRLTNRTLTSAYLSGVGSVGDPVSVEVELGTDGRLRFTIANGSGNGTGTTTVGNEWMQFGDIEPSTAALYETRFSLVSEFDMGAIAGFTGDAFDTWHGLGTARGFEYAAAAASDIAEYTRAQVRCEVREIASGIVQAVNTFDIYLRHVAGEGA